MFKIYKIEAKNQSKKKSKIMREYYGKYMKVVNSCGRSQIIYKNVWLQLNMRALIIEDNDIAKRRNRILMDKLDDEYMSLHFRLTPLRF